VTHTPVLQNEVIEAFKTQERPLLNFLDATFGRGGHSLLILNQFPDASITAFDRDAQAIEYGKSNFKKYLEDGRLKFFHDDFRNIEKYNLAKFDGALFDLGVSSPQLDMAERGFSFMHDGPLDMRMNQNQELTASEIINTYSEKDLSDIFYHWGEVRHPNRVVRAVVHDRKENPFINTAQLSSLIERVEGWKKRGVHPATNFFMALRIAVNSELEGLETFIDSLPHLLADGARVAIISFHSLEDRIVKTSFKKMHLKFGHILNKKVVIAGDVELEKNSRSRSAKLRVFEIKHQ
jgi:16S rRNA (cytosine1402-N4)-methyltransferase